MSFRDKTRLETNKAIRCGLIKKPKKCSACKVKKKLDVHHLDYTDHLNVVWLCKKCHFKWHKENVCLSIEVGLTQDEAKAIQKIRTKEHRTLKSQIRWIIRQYIKGTKYAYIIDRKNK